MQHNWRTPPPASELVDIHDALEHPPVLDLSLPDAPLPAHEKDHCIVEFLKRNNARVAYRVRGSGPPLLAPECNYTWTDTVEAQLAENFTLIVASPRDYGNSSRAGGPSYDVDAWVQDLQAVAHHVGYDRFLFFGYSFTGVFGPWLAQRLRSTRAIAAVASGGFPLLGDYRISLSDIEDQSRALQEDQEIWEQIQRRFDPLAAREFYRDLASLAPDALVDEAPCPLYCFWGDQDAEAVARVLPHEEYMAGLRQRGIPFDLYQGYDHEGLSSSLEVALPAATEWLLNQAKAERL